MTREEAIKIVQSATVWTDEERKALTMLIPEFAESEDERIRKELIETIRCISSDCQFALFLSEQQKQRYLAYLEKQKEYELTEEDKKIIPEALVMLCDDIINHRVHTPIKTDEEGARKIKAFLKTFNRQPHKTKEEWEKQKELDKCPEYCVRSHCSGCPIYEKQKEPQHAIRVTKGFGDPDGPQFELVDLQEEQKPVVTHGETYHVDTLGTQQVIAGKMPQKPAEWSEDIIRKAVKEVGLTQHQIDWFKTNVFPPKPEWSEEDERIRRTLVEYFGPKVQLDFVRGIPIQKIRDWLEKQKDIEDRWIEDRGQCFWNGVEEGKMLAEKQKEQKPIPDWMPKFLDELRSKKNYFDWDEHRDIEGHILAIINWIAPDYFKRKEEQKPAEKQDYSGLNDLERAIHRGFLSAGVENVPVIIIKETAQECITQMKPAEWSEEDEKMYNSALWHIKNSCGNGDKNSGEFDVYQWFKNRVKSIRPIKQEWSKEDERRIDAICELLENTSAIHPNYSHRKLIIWLKSLRPSWKPSEEQMEALKEAMETYDGFKEYDAMKSLYEQLKKLR